ncbi:interleukin-2 receptor subunit beta [Lynx pardinus]|uniref:Interleukin-2 receptor subunit beta n=1 Tax=Lynx pardinus TaxID=191816 RepID=A0A485PSQ0_LYNPA|nr:interleukin-2 receptor subunit beta [Lynx pardinus]
MDVMAAPGLPWCLSLLVLFLPLAIPRASTAVNDPSKLACFYNSKANISCVWSWDGDLQATSCRIHAKPDQRSWNKSCELLPMGSASWACYLILGSPDTQSLTSADTVDMRVMCHEGERWRVLMTQKFKPFENLRLMAPDSLQVTHVGTHRCNITWKVRQSSHYIERYLEFEARKRSPGHSWEEASLLTLAQNQQWICLETLTPDTQYELQVRVRPQLGKNEAWSPWSQPLAFRTRPAAPGKEAVPFSWVGHIIIGISSAFGFIISAYLLANCRYIGPWLKKVLKCHIPDPSEFFSQLKSVHGGDFQTLWRSRPARCTSPMTPARKSPMRLGPGRLRGLSCHPCCLRPGRKTPTAPSSSAARASQTRPRGALELMTRSWPPPCRRELPETGPPGPRCLPRQGHLSRWTSSHPWRAPWKEQERRARARALALGRGSGSASPGPALLGKASSEPLPPA